jgi:hypothetical protein
MDNDRNVREIGARFDALEEMPITDDQSARDALTHVMVTVSHINQVSAQARAQAMIGAGVPANGIVEDLEKWIDRLVSALTQIVEKLARAVSFSISVGSTVSVTVDFGPFGGSSA